MELDAADLVSVKLQVTDLLEVNDIQIDDIKQDEGDHTCMKYWDDTNGKELREDLVKIARKDDIDEVRRMKVWTKVPKSQCYSETGKAPIKLRWVDRNKRDEKDPLCPRA